MTVICTAERNGTNMIRKEITISDISHKNMANLIHIACIFDSDIILENSRSRINAKKDKILNNNKEMENNECNYNA